MPPRAIREESWNSLHHSEASVDNPNDVYSDASMSDASNPVVPFSTSRTSAFPTISDVHRALHPLQDTADRVGKQVEQFAESLDRLSIKKQRRSRRDCGDVLPLVHSYKRIASDTVRHLETMHAPERQQQLDKKTRRELRRSSRPSTPGSVGSNQGNKKMLGTTVEDLKFWEKEEQTWDLLGLMLQVEYPAHRESIPGKDQMNYLIRPEKGAQVHRYSAEKDVWNSFLATDDQAWERHTVLEWLKNCAEKSSQSVEQVVEALESEADRGQGLWAHSWLYTKEAIKGQKRLRSSITALDPNHPGVKETLLNSEKTQALVTQLDPDAITRQGRSLEKQDRSFERAIWLACWEMLRRGKDWEFLREWCQERVEIWRATAMHGDFRSVPLLEPSSSNWQSRELWRKACAYAAKEGGIDDYETAVYGALSGYLPAILQVSRTWHDHLFAYYDSYLLHSYDRYVRSHHPDRISKSPADRQGAFNFSVFGGQRLQSGNQIVEKMKTMDQTKLEAQEPIKMLQGSLIGRTFDNFVHKHGVRLARSANAEEQSKILDQLDGKALEGEVTAPLTLDDHEMLRLITHVIFIYQDLGLNFGDGEQYHAMESIVVAYIDYLSKAGKQQLLPSYAARLSPGRSITCLGRQLPFILDRGERQTFLRLMVQEGIQVPAVLSTQLIMIIEDSPPAENVSNAFPDLSVMERNDSGFPRSRPIKNEFIGESVTQDQQDLIHGFEWYLLLEGHWKETMMVGVVVYKHFLRKQICPSQLLNDLLTISGTRAIAAARLLSQTVTFAAISLSKTRPILGRSTDISQSPDSSEDEESEDEDYTDLSSHRRMSLRASRLRYRHGSSTDNVSNERNIMLMQSKVFKDLEDLLVALDALESWQYVSEEGKK